MTFFEHMEKYSEDSVDESEKELLKEIYKLEDDCEEYSLRVAELEKQVADLKAQLSSKDLKMLELENTTLKKEIKAAYEYTQTVNKWWKFRLERLEQSARHGHVVTKPVNFIDTK